MIYVLSDIHGREDRFNSILRQIKLKKTDHLYVLGDVIDRNPDGIRLLRRIARAENMTMLLGNHEYMMLEWIDDPNNDYAEFVWKSRNGGYITWKKWKYCGQAFKNEMLAFLRSLPINIEVTCGGKDWLLVHGAPECMYKPDSWAWESSKKYAVWFRLSELEQMPEGKTVIFGHTTTDHFQNTQPMSVFYGERRIGIDCGCAYPDGRLACLRLDDGAVFYSNDAGGEK